VHLAPNSPAIDAGTSTDAPATDLAGNSRGQGHGYDIGAYEFVTPIKTNPTITWSNPADITFGTPLGVSQLNATASVPGTFNYNPAAGTVLPTGNGQTLSVTFTPSEPTAFNSVSSRVTINVLPPGGGGPGPLTPTGDLSARVAFTPGKFLRHGRRYRQSVKVTNVSGTPISGPLALVIDGLAPKVHLVGASGVTRAGSPRGSPYVNLDLGAAGVLNPGDRVTLVL